MSKQKPEKNHELARVLARIDVLMKHGEQPAREMTVEDTAAEIPVLTEVYEGRSVTSGASTRAGAATIDQPSKQNETDESFQAEPAQTAEREAIEDILLRMRPMIEAAVREAVQSELAHVEQTLRMKLEAELTQNLREHLQTGLL